MFLKDPVLVRLPKRRVTTRNVIERGGQAIGSYTAVVADRTITDSTSSCLDASECNEETIGSISGGGWLAIRPNGPGTMQPGGNDRELPGRYPGGHATQFHISDDRLQAWG